MPRRGLAVSVVGLLILAHARPLGYAIGVAVLGSLGTVVYRATVSVPSGTPADVATSVTDNLATAFRARPGPEILESARAAFTAGMQVAATTSAALLAIVGAMTAWLLRDIPPTGRADDGQPELSAPRGQPPTPAPTECGTAERTGAAVPRRR